jgi:arylsulfatase A-like enzyme/Flp pilus assembly protein TadD
VLLISLTANMAHRLSIAGLLSLLLVACAPNDRLPPPSMDTTVILISVDTLRSDRLPAYGYEAVATPHLDAFRADAILYEHAYSHYPLTLPAHVSLLSGLLPADHGVRDNVGYKMGEEVPSIVAILKENGYATGAAVSSFVLRQEMGLARGFDFYDDQVQPVGRHRALGLIQRAGDETVEVAKTWIADQQGPFFFLLHLYDPHTPYDPPEPYRSRYQDPYDGEVAWTDEVVGDFLKDLKTRGIYDDALIIFLSDHGEGLGDHGEDEHGLFLYREAIQIPLIMKLPKSKFAGSTVSSPAQLIDIFPTILERVGLNVDLGRNGTTSNRMSLTTLIHDPPTEPRLIYSESYYPRFHFGWSDLHSLIDGTNHYIHAPTPELYRLDEDFREQHNVLESRRPLYFAMREQIEPYIRAADAPLPVSPEEAAKLAALGYLGSTVQTRPGEELPDPKDKIDTFRDMTRAFTEFRDGRLDESLALIDRHLAENHRIVDLWSLKSKVLTRMGRYDEAILAAREALTLSPQMSHITIDLAELYLRRKQLDEAEQHADLLMESEPARAHDFFARIAIERGDLDRAEREAELAASSARDKVFALITLARVKRDRDKLEEALAILDRAQAARKSKQVVQNLHFMRGDVLARLGRGEEAEKEFREEIRLFPEEPQPYKNLMLVLAAEGRLKEATQLVYELLEASPTPPAYAEVVHMHQVLGDERGARYWTRKGLEQFPNDQELRKLAAELSSIRGVS